MFLIYKDGEIVERAETLRYILRQDNGVAVISTQESYNAVYSPATDKLSVTPRIANIMASGEVAAEVAVSISICPS